MGSAAVDVYSFSKTPARILLFILAAAMLPFCVGCGVNVAAEPGRTGCSTASLAARQFTGFVNRGDAANAFAMYAVNKFTPPAMLQRERNAVDKFCSEARQGHLRYKYIDSMYEGPCGVAIINEFACIRGLSNRYNHLFLVQVEGHWCVVPGRTDPNAAKPFLTDRQYMSYETLQKWFGRRKSELCKPGK